MHGDARASASATSTRITATFVSEALSNREGDVEGVPYGPHGDACAGFNTSHFAPDAIAAGARSADRLHERTGLRWTSAPVDSLVNLAAKTGTGRNAVAYVYDRVFSPRSGRALLAVGSDDGVAVWVNGEPVLRAHQGRELALYSDLIWIDLREGDNHVLYKVDQGDGGWGLHRRVIDDPTSTLVWVSPYAYGDLVETAVLPDSSTSAPLRADARRAADAVHRVSLSWGRPGQAPSSAGPRVYDGPGRDTPAAVALPASFDGHAVLDVAVTGPGGVVYRERIPVFSASGLSETAGAIRLADTPDGRAKRGALDAVLAESDDRSRSYSTRFVADVVHDAALASHGLAPVSGPTVHGVEVRGQVHPYRLFTPAQTDIAPARPSAVLSYGTGDGTAPWSQKEAASHVLTVRRTALATATGTPLALPTGPPLDDFPEVLDAIAASVGARSVIAFSAGAADVLGWLGTPGAPPLDRVIFVSPLLQDADAANRHAATYDRRRHPTWTVRYGMADQDVPSYVPRRFIDRLRGLSAEVDYHETPHASHWVWINDPVRLALASVRHAQS